MAILVGSSGEGVLMWTWIFVALFVIPLTMLVTYVVVRERHHPVDHPPKGGGQGWGNLWPR